MHSVGCPEVFCGVSSHDFDPVLAEETVTVEDII